MQHAATVVSEENTLDEALPCEGKMTSIIAHRNRLVAHWAASLMKLSSAEVRNYGNTIVALGCQPDGEAEIIDRLATDFAERHIGVDPDRVLQEFGSALLVAERCLMHGDHWSEAA